MAVFEIFECAEPLRMTRVQTFLLEFDESWVTLSDQCRNHDFEVLNQSISVRNPPISRRPNIRTSYPIHGSSQLSVFREDFRQINCSQSVKMEIWCCKEICQIYATREYLLIQIWILGTTNYLKNIFRYYFLKIHFYSILVEITPFQSHSIFLHREK